MNSLHEWLFSSGSAVLVVPISALITYAVITLLVRVMGLRSFSKMSSTDFVTTVAIGSLMAGIISAPSPSIIIGLAALLSIFAIKWIIAAARRHTQKASIWLDNEPIFLMRGQQILKDNLDRANISELELHAKLREANVWSYEQVIGVVLETTGDVSVLHRPADDASLTQAIFDDVQGDPPASNVMRSA